MANKTSHIKCQLISKRHLNSTCFYSCNETHHKITADTVKAAFTLARSIHVRTLLFIATPPGSSASSSICLSTFNRVLLPSLASTSSCHSTLSALPSPSSASPSRALHIALGTSSFELARELTTALPSLVNLLALRTFLLRALLNASNCDFFV